MRTALTSALALAATAALAQDAVRLEREALVVDDMAHWRQWQGPLGAFAFEDSAWRRPSARIFFGRLVSWLRTTGPIALPPPRNCGTRAEP